MASSMDSDFTQRVINAMGPKTNPRVREIMGPLIQHIHDFAREVGLTWDEWMAGVNIINEAGKMSDERRNEGQLVCDVLGLESLVDEITFSQAANAPDAATASAILGPFFRIDAPAYENGESMVRNIPEDGQIAYMHGTVTDAVTGQPIKDVVINAWQASTNGLYEQQDPDQVDCNLRGKWKTDENGFYGFYCLRPTPYPVPYDGPAGKILQALDRHPWRPAHIHLITTHADYKPITTQIFDSNCQYLENDSVFAVKDSLIVKFEPLEGNPKANLELNYNIRLARSPAAAKQ